MDVLIALYVGKVDLLVLPADPVADKLMTILYKRFLDNFVQIAVEDFLLLGMGGIAMTIEGYGLIKPENFVAYPDFLNPEWTARTATIRVDEAVKRYGYEPFKKEVEAIEQTDDPLRYYLAEPVEVVELMTDDTVFVYYNDNLIMARRRLPWEGHYFMRSYHRYEIPGAYERTSRNIDLPISLFELLMGIRHEDVPAFEAHSKLMEALTKYALRSNFIAYRASGVDKNSKAWNEFRQTYKPIGVDGDPNAIYPIDKVSLNEIQYALREIEQHITAITGVTPYMLAQVGLANTATETLTMQQMANIKASFLQTQIQQWLNNVVENFRYYLINIPENEQIPVSFVEKDDSNQMREFIYGVPDAPYALGLMDKQVYISSMGFQEQLARRTELQTMLSFLVGIYQLLVQHGAVYDIPKLIDNFISTFGFDPTDYRINLQQGATPSPDEEQQTNTIQPTNPEQGPIFQTHGTPNPEYARLNSIMGILNRVQQTMPTTQKTTQQILLDTLEGLQQE